MARVVQARLMCGGKACPVTQFLNRGLAIEVYGCLGWLHEAKENVMDHLNKVAEFLRSIVDQYTYLLVCSVAISTGFQSTAGYIPTEETGWAVQGTDDLVQI
jgi:hypothetical protein